MMLLCAALDIINRLNLGKCQNCILNYSKIPSIRGAGCDAKISSLAADRTGAFIRAGGSKVNTRVQKTRCVKGMRTSKNSFWGILDKGHRSA